MYMYVQEHYKSHLQCTTNYICSTHLLPWNGEYQIPCKMENITWLLMLFITFCSGQHVHVDVCSTQTRDLCSSKTRCKISNIVKLKLLQGGNFVFQELVWPYKNNKMAPLGNTHIQYMYICIQGKQVQIVGVWRVLLGWSAPSLQQNSKGIHYHPSMKTLVSS